jgi:hypothetical protein
VHGRVSFCLPVPRRTQQLPPKSTCGKLSCAKTHGKRKIPLTEHCCGQAAGPRGRGLGSLLQLGLAARMDGDEDCLNGRSRSTGMCRIGARGNGDCLRLGVAGSGDFVATFTKFHCGVANLIGQRARLPGLPNGARRPACRGSEKEDRQGKDERHGPF